jgi:siroheme synthase-like protein
VTTPAGQRPDLHGFPLVLLLGDRKVVVIGAGHIATRKVENLITGGAENITVIAPTATNEIVSMANENLITYVQREFEESDVDDAFFVMTATEKPDVNRTVFLSCEARNIFVNSADDPNNCSAILMSTVRQGDVTIAISTAGKSPAFAKWLRKYLQGRLGPEYGVLITLINDERENLRSRGISTEDINWDPAFNFDVVALAREGKIDEVRSAISTIVESSLASLH